MGTPFRSLLLALTTLMTVPVHDAAGAPENGAKPSIVLIFADDLGYGDVGCYGATKVKTPNIDRLAREGRRFLDAHSASAVCTPSRYALLTGEYAFRKNIWGPLSPEHPLWIAPNRLTLARLLKEQGYATACVGKWHLGFGTEKTDWNQPLKPGPLELGFDYYYGIPFVSSGPPFVYVENHRVVGWDPADPFVLRQKNDPRPPSPVQKFPEKNGTDRWAGASRAHQLYRDEELGTTLADKAVKWIKENKDQRFFLYFATPQIHHPFTPHPRFKGTSDCGIYGDFVHELDWMVGQVLDTLDALGLARNTLVLFTSDNGGMLNDGGKSAWKAGHRLNGDLLGFKFGAWEGGHRVPFIARWPGHIEPASTSSQLLCNVDMLATLATLVGHRLGRDDGVDSFNVLPALLGNPEAPLRDHLVMAPFRQTNLAIRAGRWIYIGARGSGGFGGNKGGPGALAFTGEVNSDITPEGKYRDDAPSEQLYDLEADLPQALNVVRQHPEVAAELKALLERIEKAERTRPE